MQNRTISMQWIKAIANHKSRISCAVFTADLQKDLFQERIYKITFVWNGNTKVSESNQNYYWGKLFCFT